jgi:hypothetical protein
MKTRVVRNGWLLLFEEEEEEEEENKGGEKCVVGCFLRRKRGW